MFVDAMHTRPSTRFVCCCNEPSNFIQRLLARDQPHRAGINLSNATANFVDLRSLNLWGNALGQPLDKAIGEVGALRSRKPIYLGKKVGNCFSH
jgi:hypothetical protein